MKAWIKRVLIGLAGTGLLAGGMAACSHRMHGPGHHLSRMSEADVTAWRERLVERAGQKLDLSAPQKLKLTALGEALQQQRRALIGPAGSTPRAELQALLAGQTLDRERALALVQAKTAAVHTHAPAVVAAAAEFFDGLNPAQQQQLRDLMARGRRGPG